MREMFIVGMVFFVSLLLLTVLLLPRECPQKVESHRFDVCKEKINDQDYVYIFFPDGGLPAGLLRIDIVYTEEVGG